MHQFAQFKHHKQTKMKTVEEIINENGYTLDYLKSGSPIFQSKNMYTFSSDSTALAGFVKNEKIGTLVDLCSGSGIVGLEVIDRIQTDKLVLVEFQLELAKMSECSARFNKSKTKINVINADINNLENYMKSGEADVVVCNPPYFKVGSGYKPVNESRALARHEINLTLKTLIEKVNYILKAGGDFYLVHIADRLPEIDKLLNSNNFKTVEKKLLSGKLERVLIYAKKS